MATVRGTKWKSRGDVTLNGKQGEGGLDTVAKVQKETLRAPQDSIPMNALLWRRQFYNGLENWRTESAPTIGKAGGATGVVRWLRTPMERGKARHSLQELS